MNAREQLAIFLAIMLSVVYAVIALASIKTGEFTALTIFTPVELLVVGYAVGVKPSEMVNGKRRNGEDTNGKDQ